jgi:hypothetical protein
VDNSPVPPLELSPTARAFELIAAHAPSEPGAFWRFAAAAVAKHAPADGSARRRYISDMNVALHAAFASKCNLPDDAGVYKRIRDCLFIVEGYAQLRARAGY